MGYPHYSGDCDEHHRLVLDGPRARVLSDVHGEREAQDEKWGPQNHPDGTGSRDYAGMADEARTACDDKHKSGRGTWADILKEEFYEALAESDPVRLRDELIQVAAVAVSWVEAIDRRGAERAEALFESWGLGRDQAGGA